MSDVAEARGAGLLQRRPDWRIATALCLVPGLGQLYNGQPRKSLFFMLCTVLTIGPAVLLITAGERFGHTLLDQRVFVAFLIVALGSVLLFLILFVIGLFFWASSVRDARRTALALRHGDVEQAAKVSFFRL